MKCKRAKTGSGSFKPGLKWIAAALLAWPMNILAQDCTPDTIILTSQAEVDDFQVNHGPCDRVVSFLFVGPSTDITNLDNLNGLVDIFGLHISGNSNLTDISGLSSLGTASGIVIQNNPLDSKQSPDQSEWPFRAHNPGRIAIVG
jgi:hypothetical protein